MGLVSYAQERLVSDLVRIIYSLDETGAELVGELTSTVKTRRVPMTGALTRKLGTGRGMKPRLVWPVRR